LAQVPCAPAVYCILPGGGTVPLCALQRQGTAMKAVARMTLKDGRKLAWREYGSPGGYPVFFFHGNLNSRLFQACWDKEQEITEAADARLIAVDRPGYGSSDYLPGRTYASWSSDVSELAGHLGCERFAVFGFSSGGPNALACAVRLPSKVAACGLMSSDGPYKILGMVKEMFGSEVLSQEIASERTRQKHEELIQSYAGLKPGRKELALADLANAACQGLEKGPSQDCQLEAGDWGFRASDVDGTQVPVHLWHGVADKDVPVEVAHYLAKQIPGVAARFIEGESHSMVRRKWGEFLELLVATAREGYPSLPSSKL